MNSSSQPDQSQRPLLHPQGSMNGANQENILKPCYDRIQILGVTTIAIFMAITAAAVTNYNDIKLPRGLFTMAIIISIFSQFISGIALVYYALHMSTLIRLTLCQYILHILFVSFHGFTIISTGLLVVALLEYKILLLACFLVPMMLIIGILGYAGREMNRNDEQGQTLDETFKNAIKSCSEVCKVTTGIAFSTQVAIVLAHFMNPSLSKTHGCPRLDLSATIATFLAGVFSLTITALPLELMPCAIRLKLVIGIKRTERTMIIVTVVSLMIIGAKFLDGLVVLALLPEMTVHIIYQSFVLLGKDVNGSEANNLNDEAEIPASSPDIIKYCCAALLLVIYAFYTGRDEKSDIYLRVLIFILISVTIANLSQMIITLKPLKIGECWVFSNVKVIASIFPGLQMLTACFVLLKFGVDFYKTNSY